MKRVFNRLLTAKYSPENKCFAEDGAILVVFPRKKLITKKKDSISHHFVDSLDGKTRSQFGWVKVVDPFQFEDFVSKYCPTAKDDDELAHILKMLEGISALNEDTPVAATYFERGIEEKRLEFKVHKVFFR